MIWEYFESSGVIGDAMEGRDSTFLRSPSWPSSSVCTDT